MKDDFYGFAYYVPTYQYDWYWYYNIPGSALLRFRECSERGHVEENADFFLGLTKAKIFWWTYKYCESNEMRQKLMARKIKSFEE